MANGTLAASQIEMLSQSGTGIITITPPATNTNRAITLPDAAGAIVVSGTTPSLNGITFPATQVASADANTLDDYEEGTWTPVYRGDVTAGTFTYLAQTGRYTKIGNTVVVHCGLFDISESSAASGYIQITGLPFTAANIAILNYTSAINLSRFTLGGEGQVANLERNTAIVIIVDLVSGSSSGNLLSTTARTGNNSDISFSLTYQVA
jgi:hypothetical protein